MSIDSAILVLSDLHFGNDLPEAAATQLLNVPAGFDDAKLTPYFEQRCKGHYVPCVKRLPRYLRGLLSELKEDGYARDKFDLVILLGDQSTLTHERSFKFLREYLTQKDYLTKDADGGVQGCKGLDVDPKDILAIPGNHDKLLRTSLDLYHEEFTRKAKLREEVRPQMCSIAIRHIAHREWIFILVEASNYCSQDLKLGRDFRSHLAAGKIGEKLIEDVETKLGMLREHGKLDAELKLNTSFKETMKVLLVHYAVDESRFSSGLDEIVLPHQCDGLGDFVNMLREEYQLNLALHGHLHCPLLYNFNGVQIVSATTATRMDRRGKTGFFVLKVLDTGTVRAEHHVWTGVDYTPDPDKNLSRDVGYIPGTPLAA